MQDIHMEGTLASRTSAGGTLTDAFPDAYDPDQNEEEKRHVRKRYRDLTKRLDEGASILDPLEVSVLNVLLGQSNMHDVTAEGIAAIIREADNNYEQGASPTFPIPMSPHISSSQGSPGSYT